MSGAGVAYRGVRGGTGDLYDRYCILERVVTAGYCESKPGIGVRQKEG